MKYLNRKQRSAILLFLLVVGWVIVCPLSAKAFLINDIPQKTPGYALFTDSLLTDVEELLVAPQFSQNSCDFFESFDLTISDLNESAASIIYTTDGSEPNAENGLTYTDPITIPAGQDVTVKAVSITENGISTVTTATFRFVVKHLLSVKMPNKNGINYVYYSTTTSEYGQWNDDGSAYITEGSNVSVGYALNSGYKCKSVMLNGVAQDVSGYFDFVMPASDVQLVIDTEFDPSSPADPQPADTTKKFNLKLVCNPAAAGEVNGDGKYAVGSSAYVYAYTNSGYVFTGWTKDGEMVSTNSSMYYTMPASDVVLTANYVYNPSSPSDPQQPTLKHPLTVIASPAGSGSFSSSGSEVTYGEEYYVYAYPNTGYKFKGWIVNGVAQEDASTPLRRTMTDAGASVVGLFVFDPSSPANPGANYYNSTTGQVIIDDFSSGNLYSALSNIVGNDNFANVSSLIVKGRMESGDYGSLSYLSNAGTIDLSRTGGTTDVPGYAFQNLSAANILLSSEVSTIGNYAFSNCTNLTSLTVYAQVPPTCSSYTFSGFTNINNCTVYVPASAIELYATADYWKDFTILPINTDAHVLQVNLPSNASDGRYKYNSLEIVNINSGVRQKYVISDRLLYTFNGLRKDEQYNVYMYSQAGLEIGRIENVVIPDQDIEVTLDNLKPLHNVSAKVLSSDGSDVTSQVTVEWLKPLTDGTITYLRKAISLGGVPDGQQLICRVSLGNKLGTVYLNPEDINFTVSEEQNICTVTLVPFRTITLTGTVVDGDGTALSGASVSVNQMLNGKYFKTFTSKTDRSGSWTVTMLDAPETYLTYAASEYINVNDTIGAFATDVSALDMGKTTLKSIVGARITYGFTYHAAGVDEVETYYSDYQNVAVSVFNVTQNRPHNEISLQYPLLAVLDENINEGDELRLIATSKNGAFNAIEQTVTIDGNQRAEVTFDIVGKGGLSASFETTDNPEVIAMLYSSKGELLKKTTYSEAAALFTELEDGEYTLITMGQSDLMNSVLRLSSFTEIGLTEGKDYVKNTVTVESGKLTEVKNAEIPAFDESLFYYTNSSTSFSSNKSSITTGNYLTLRSAIDFKSVYKEGISNVALVVDLPEACDFVEQSVIQGPNLLPYTIDNNRLTVQLGNNYNSQVRFCVVPTAGGAFNATASVVFDYGGKTITQPIGSAISEIKNIEISVPSVIAGTSFKVTGTALSQSEVKVYEDGTLLGSGKVNGAGTWNVECELTDPYNLSTHSIYAEITTPAGNTLTSETKSLTYDMNALQVSKVTMYHWNPEMNKTYTSEFDFLNPKTAATQWTVYYPKKVFTYTIEFTDNDPERISNVILYVHTADGRFVPCEAKFDEQKGLWYTEIDMGNSSDGYYPVNCSVDFDFNSKVFCEIPDYTQYVESVQDNFLFITNQFDEIDSYVAKGTSLTETEKEHFNEKYSVITNSSDEDFLPKGFDEWTADEQDDFISKYFEENQEFFDLDSVRLNKIIEAFSSGNTSTGSIIFEDGSSIETETCANISEEELLLKNYVKVEMIDSSAVYVLVSDEISAIANFSTNQHIIVKTPRGEIKYFNGKSLAPAFISNAIGVIRNLGDKARNWSTDNTFITTLDFIKTVSGSINDGYSTVNKGFQDIIDKTEENWRKQSSQYGRYKALGKRCKNPAKRLMYQALALDAQATAGKLFVVFKGTKLVLGSALKAIPIADWLFIIGDSYNKGTDLYDMFKYLDKVKICKEEQKTIVESYRSNVRWLTAEVVNYEVGTISLNVVGDLTIAAGIAASLETAGISLAPSVISFLLKTAGNIGFNLYNNHILDPKISNLKGEIKSLKFDCPKDPDSNDSQNPNNGNNVGNGGVYQSGSPGDNVQIDPSGYVYEAIPANRVEGVQATIYYKETKEDMYGDPYEEIVLWNAEEYAQKNPLFTDENGMYRWDVPQGLWQVKFEKDGYVTAYSEWLPVPPPQLEVNIGITQNKQPEVIEARAYEEGVEVLFDKFMDLSTLTTDNIYVTANGEKLNGEVHFIDSSLADEYASEDDTDAMRYASRIRFVPETPLSVTTGEIRVTVSRNVQSYAGIPMTETFSQVLDVEKEVQAISASDVKVLYGGEKEITIYAAPYEAAVGRTLHIANSSSLIASVATDKIILDDEGKAVVTVKGELPGCAQLTFTIDDVTVTGACAVDVVTEIITAEAPKASRASGTAVYRGTKIELTTDSKDATIYFTTDGSCPCDENGTRRKYTIPIIIDEDTRILAMTSVGTGDEDVSETVEFNYTLKRSDMDFQMEEGWTWISHNFESGVSPSVLASDESVSRILSQTQELIRDPQLGLVGTLTEMTAPESYKVETTAATARQRLSDVAWNPATPISLNAGWNWLGYPVGQTMSVNEAFATTDVETLDVIVGQNGFAQFDGEKWIGTLETMSPGMGYMYQSQSEKNVVYNTSIVSTAAARYVAGISNNLPLVLDIHKYGEIMPVVATINSINGSSLKNEDYQVAAFCGTECRGIGRVVDGLVMMNVYGNTNDKITFQVTDVDGEQIFSNDVSLNFSEKVIGDILNPYVITINNTTGITNATYSGDVKILITGDVLEIRGIDADDIELVEIYDMSGHKLISKTNVSDSRIRIPALTADVYIVVVNGKGKYTYHKIVIR